MNDASRWRSSRTGAVTRVKEALGMARLLLSPGASRTTAIYDILSAHNNLGDNTLYLNMGYWRDARSYDEACEALAVLLAERAQLAAGQCIVDAGFGFADQDILWAQRYGVDIVGFNITARQVDIARERVANAGLAARVDLRCASALETDLAAASVDRVLALESAFHFPSREAFFAEARRVLVPGGILAIADICAAKQRSSRWIDRLNTYVARQSWQIPRGNDYDAHAYAERLTAAGFIDVSIESITDEVFLPFGAYARMRQADPDIVARANPLMRAVWRSPATDRVFDYVVITARKPEAQA